MSATGTESRVYATVTDMSNVFAFEWCSCIYESGFR